MATFVEQMRTTRTRVRVAFVLVSLECDCRFAARSLFGWLLAHWLARWTLEARHFSDLDQCRVRLRAFWSVLAL